jgi:hypothetical protein
MKTLKYTLLADGSSDKTLLRIIQWSLDNLFPTLATERNFADFRHFINPPKTLQQKVEQAKLYYPSNIWFIHRDAEKNDVQWVDKRMEEIRKQIGEAEFEHTVCVIPVKMMETWLLISEEAIKRASGNRSYKQAIDLPQLKNLENEKNPKVLLHSLLKTCSGHMGRKLASFNANYAVHLVAEYISDYTPLRQLPAFNAFETELKNKVNYFLTSTTWN